MQGQRLGLNEPVLFATAGVAGMDMVDVEASVNVLHSPVDVGAAKDVLIVKHSSGRIVAANSTVKVGTPSPVVVRREPDLRERGGGRFERHALPLGLAILGGLAG